MLAEEKSETEQIPSKVTIQKDNSNPKLDKKKKNDELFILDDFVVTGEQNRGYYSANSIAGTRTNELIKNIPSTISVVNEQMIEDLDLRDIADFSNVLIGVESDEFSSFERLRFRGFVTLANYFEFYTRKAPSDSFIIDRADVIRGANSFLYGQSDPGGKINTTVKRPQYFGNKININTSLGSDNNLRFTFDRNMVINDTFAVRLMGVKQKSDSAASSFAEREKDGVALGLNFRPSSKTSIGVHLEFINDRRDGSPVRLPMDWRLKNGTNPQYDFDFIDGLVDENGDRLGLFDSVPDKAQLKANMEGLYLGPDYVTANGRPDLVVTDFNLLPEIRAASRVAELVKNQTKSFVNFTELSHQFNSSTSMKWTLFYEQVNTDAQNVTNSNFNPHYGSLTVPNRSRVFLPLQSVAWDDLEYVMNTQLNQTERFWRNYGTRLTLLHKFDIANNEQKILWGLDFDKNFAEENRYKFSHGYTRAGAPLANITQGTITRVGLDEAGLRGAFDWDGTPASGFNYSDPNNYFRPLDHKESDGEGLGAWSALSGQWLNNRLYTLLGLRWDRVSFESVDFDYSNGLEPQDKNSFSADESRWKTSLGALYWVTSNVAFFANYAQASVAPDGFAQGPLGDIPEQESGDGIEGGVKFDFLNGRLTGMLTAYQIEKDNVRKTATNEELADLYPDVFDKDGNGIYDASDYNYDEDVYGSAIKKVGGNIAGESNESTGIELEFNYNPSKNLSMSFGYGWLDAIKTDSKVDPRSIGNPVEGTAKNTLKFVTRYTLETDNFLNRVTIGTALKYRGKQLVDTYYIDVDRDNLRIIEVDQKTGEKLTLEDRLEDDIAVHFYANSYVTVSPFISWRSPGKKGKPSWNVSFNVNNILDERGPEAKGRFEAYIKPLSWNLRVNMTY